MILHFSQHVLTDGLTLMIPFGDCPPAARLWLPPGPPLPSRGHAMRARSAHLRRTDDGSNSEPCSRGRRCRPGAARSAAPARLQRGLAAPSGAVSAGAAACLSTFQGVSMLGPSAVVATVNSKCAAGDPSWEQIAQPS